jgi:glycosyltransferase involved in cell wall biosynthesis
MQEESYKAKMKALKIVIVVPTYNNDTTLAKVLDSLLLYTDDIIVVNDGSTDKTGQILGSYSTRLKIISYSSNKGKGYALKCGFRAALKMSYDYALTIDSDGQHYVNDVVNFIKEVEDYPDSLIIGSRLLMQENKPEGNVFANRFSNFWFHLQTGINLPDTQSGYRMYPLKKMGKMKLFTRRYETELELLVFSAWRGIALRPMPISVYYPPKNERISHFRPFRDFTRISILNTTLVFMAVVYGYPSMLIRKIFKV